MAAGASNNNVRIVFWRVDFQTRGPGEALAHIISERPNTQAMARIIANLSPDILVLSGIDYDQHAVTLRAFRDQIAELGPDLPHTHAPKPNAGFPSGLDLNGDGWAHGPDDAHGYAEYAGARSLGVLSRYPFQLSALRDFSQVLWRDLPGALLYHGAQDAQLSQHRLSTVAHIDLPVVLPNGAKLALLVYQAGPPVFGDHPNRNRNRNHDETAFWTHLLNGTVALPPAPPFVLIGGSNLDPHDGDGLHEAMRALLSHSELQDPQPASMGAVAQADADHSGPSNTDTVDWDAPQGNLRVAYILPSRDLRVIGTGVLWPMPDDPLSDILAQTGTAHKPVWVDIALN